MSSVYLYSYVEDAPSAEVAKKIVDEVNTEGEGHVLAFYDGFPNVTRGYGKIKVKVPSFLAAAKAGVAFFVITDLDEFKCSQELICTWFSIDDCRSVSRLNNLVFRVAVREIESWILADRESWADYIGIPVNNFSTDPDGLPDPKLHLINVLRKKGKKKIHLDMLPTGSASIGPRYNEVLCDFIKKHWSPARASVRSDSLERARKAIKKLRLAQ